MRAGVLDLVKAQRHPGIKDFAMTTNGILLPEMAADLNTGPGGQHQLDTLTLKSTPGSPGAEGLRTLWRVSTRRYRQG